MCNKTYQLLGELQSAVCSVLCFDQLIEFHSVNFEIEHSFIQMLVIVMLVHSCTQHMLPSIACSGGVENHTCSFVRMQKVHNIKWMIIYITICAMQLSRLLVRDCIRRRLVWCEAWNFPNNRINNLTVDLLSSAQSINFEMTHANSTHTTENRVQRAAADISRK